ncbi:hypothetical protein Rhe02_77960 [Rhizocola hellebori]|uniref:Uncharacterized protein n=1 Tax=Rhizocola hellebori TaxID=1392758 RepID=A0A8J3VJS7_9ACTN|nr:hypothetical protein Rhe02_77960 [Rhizocola hellebori]
MGAALAEPAVSRPTVAAARAAAAAMSGLTLISFSKGEHGEGIALLPCTAYGFVFRVTLDPAKDRNIANPQPKESVFLSSRAGVCRFVAEPPSPLRT